MYNEAPMQLQKKQNNKNYLHIAIFLYWAILVVWQNISEYALMSTMDTAIKIGLIVFLIISYFAFAKKNQAINPMNLALFTVFMLTQLITLFFEPNIAFRTIVSYVFPLLFLFLSFVYGSNYKISQKEFVFFLNCVIAVVAYSAIYAVIFKNEYFTQAFSISSAYGNELSSFFVSNHEYGMYLLAGIISCIICFEYKKDKPFINKILYIFCIILFMVNLVLTFSRTSILAMVGFLTIYILFRGKSKVKAWLIAAIVAMILAYAIVEPFREFILKIVLKENNSAGRDVLYELAVDLYKESDFIHQLFGSGIQTARSFFDVETSHGSVHNGYLQVLVYYGLVGLIFMLSFIICRFYAAIRLLKQDKFSGTISIALVVSCALLMFTNTTILFNSPIDSFFLTAFFIVVPKYLENGVLKQGDSV